MKRLIISLKLFLRDASDCSDEGEDDEDSEYGAMAEQLEGFLGDDGVENDHEEQDN